MNAELYLDTARLGRMCHGARMAEQDFSRLVSQLPSPLYFGRFLSHGFRSLPERFLWSTMVALRHRSSVLCLSRGVVLPAPQPRV